MFEKKPYIIDYNDILQFNENILNEEKKEDIKNQINKEENKENRMIKKETYAGDDIPWNM